MFQEPAHIDILLQQKNTKPKDVTISIKKDVNKYRYRLLLMEVELH